MKLTLGFSPCPNDTFIFDALVNHKIDTGYLEFELLLEDVETLNKLALKNTLDISKISYGALPFLLDNYVVLNSGSALGSGVGPLLITRDEISISDIDNSIIAIPGEHTTAHLLFSLAYPNAKKKVFLRYNEIEDFVLSGSSRVSPAVGGGDFGGSAGVIIHENRFTYEQKGLVKIMDLGEFWEHKTKLPIPLGGIVAKRSIEPSLLKKIDSLIKQSIEYSFKYYPVITKYVHQHSQEMEEDIIRKHIDLYVNKYSIDLGAKGKDAIEKFLTIYQTLNPSITTTKNKIFLQ
jgi:1,4-dihydroxy-6-naphthoate synthase